MVSSLRGKVVFPDTVSSFDVGRLVSLTAVSRASEQQNMTLFVCAQRDMTKDDIKPRGRVHRRHRRHHPSDRKTRLQ